MSLCHRDEVFQIYILMTMHGFHSGIFVARSPSLDSQSKGSRMVTFGLLRVFSVVMPFLYIGTLISKNFAALLEEHDIFVPEDDDDDD
ncbi:essential MCU regulator, mitochondrial [Mixophyes fleayi]|uniref:essential MCU regulator, mitochondrial n=1 Tax=Mixophyes fleayi TaxID=3061075 RepID=UPI003F4DBBB7